MYGLILMDLDNTLFDFSKAENTALALAFKALKKDFDPEKTPFQYKAKSKEFWKALERKEITLETLRRLRWSDFASGEEECIQMDRQYIHFLGKQATLFPGALDAVQKLAKKYPLVAITNGIAEVQRSRWEKSPLKDYFQNLIISGEVGWVKPDPRIFKAAFEPWEKLLEPKQVLMVGDSFSADMTGALACGFDTCMVGSEVLTRNQRDLITWKIEKVDELPTLLEVCTKGELESGEDAR